ncbi:hypothetical protein QWY85_09175 [Neolewinella lacunae]|uniref:Uncharacterized protein n=1 Tax=Neolewinella lacunae TaxID=1517758 RepID=A0A923PTM7_9BACT|nr:hypothetical protein [Neolewinella lacunae]MBC6996607.1 hypothetical protein [Neolewinella lacunae]MDN3634829.1 hypothetical protein [Neolewinella lacunae]
MKSAWVFVFGIVLTLLAGPAAPLSAASVLPASAADTALAEAPGTATAPHFLAPPASDLLEFFDTEELQEKEAESVPSPDRPRWWPTEDRVVFCSPLWDIALLLPRGKRYLLFHALKVYC